MEKNTAVKGISPEMLNTYKMLKCAFPEGIEPEAYLPLLAVLHEMMSIRSVAQAIADYKGEGDYVLFYHDVIRAASPDHAFKVEVIAQVKERLLPCGYEQWLKEME